MGSLDKTAQAIESRIKDQFDSKGLNDTGKGKGSISAKADGNKIIVEGLARVLFLEYGRGGNKNYNSESWKELMPIIRPWVVRRLGVPDSENFGLARYISDKIAREGTDIFTDQAKGLQLELIVADILEKALNEVANEQARISLKKIEDFYKD